MNVAASVPHLTLFVSDLTAVSDTKAWLGTKVRVVGRLKQFHISQKQATVVSLQEVEGGNFSIPVDLSVADSSKIINNSVVCIIGEIQCMESALSITAKIVIDYSSMNVQQYAESLDFLRKKFPKIMNEKIN